MPTFDNLTASQSQSPLMEMETDEEKWDDIEIPLSGLIAQGESDEMMVDNDDERKEDYIYRHHVNSSGGFQTNTGDILLGVTIRDSDDNAGEVMRASSSYNSYLKNTKFNSSSDSAVTNTDTTSHASKQRRIIKENVKAMESIFCVSGLANFAVPKSTLSGNKEFTGTITRLGESKKVVDMSDWDNDMEIPETGLSLSNLVKTRSPASNKSNEIDKIIMDNDDHENFDNWDEEFQKFSQGEPCLPQSQNRNIVIKKVEDPTNIYSPLTSEKAVESFDQDFDLLDVDINKLNLSAEALKVHSNGGEACEETVDLFDSESVSATTEIHSRNSSILSSPVSPSSGSQSEDEGFDDIQFPESMDSLRLLPNAHSVHQSSPQVRVKDEDSSSWNVNTKDHRSLEDDNDDWSGLEVQDDNVFEPVNLKHKNIVSRTVPTQQKRPRRESFTIEFTPPSLMQVITENSTNFTLGSSQIDCSSMIIDNTQSADSSIKKPTAQKDSTTSSITRSTVSPSKKVSSRPKREVVVSAKIPSITSSVRAYKSNTVSSKNRVLPKASGLSSTPKEKEKSSMTSNKKSLPKKTISSVNTTTGSTKENLSSPNTKHKKDSSTRSKSTCSKSTCSDSSEKSARSISLSSFSSKSSTKNSKTPSSSSSTNKKPSTRSLTATKKNTANSKTPQPHPKSSSIIVHPISPKTAKSQPGIRLFNNCSGDSLLMLKQNKLKNYGDGTELDGFDDLPICLEKERDFKIYPASPVLGVANNNYNNNNNNNNNHHNNNDNDVKESVFQNLSNLNDRKSSVSSSCSKTSDKSSSIRKKNKRKKPQLIRNLNFEKNVKVIGEMVYDPISQRWDGNESVLKDFELSQTRPALITNMSPSTNTKSLQVVGDMVFDTKKMCWFHKGEDEESLTLFDSEFDCGEDNMPPIKYHTVGGFATDKHDHNNNELTLSSQAFSDDENLVMGKKGRRRILDRSVGNGDEVRGMESGGSEFQVGSEFEMSKGFLRSLMASEKQHRKEMNHWYPAIRSISNEQRFGLKDSSFQRGFLYDIRKSNTKNQSIAKIHQKSGLSKLYSSFHNKSISSRCHERPHFR